MTDNCPTLVRIPVESTKKLKINVTFRYHSPENVHKLANKMEAGKRYYTSPIRGLVKQSISLLSVFSIKSKICGYPSHS